jgi:hypothetical protein
MSFQTFVDFFHLAIKLGVICSNDIQLGTLKMKQFLPKIVSEGGITIKHNGFRHAMQFKNIIHEDL